MKAAVPSPSRWGGRRRNAGVAALGLVATSISLLLVAHRAVPGSMGSMVDSVLPWLFAPALLVLLVAAGFRIRRGIAASLVPALIWGLMYGPVLVDHARDGGHDLRVASLNVGAATPSVALPPLLAEDPDVIVLEEITAKNRAAVTRVLTEAYPHSAFAGTVAVFSRLPLSRTKPVDIHIGWTRAMVTTVTTPKGPIRLYAAHLASARADKTAERDRTLAALAAAVHADPTARLLLAGDLNTATTDRQFSSFAPLHDTQQEAGAGFGFTWPAGFPVVRPDHILERGLTTRRAWVLRAPGSDHRAVLADFDTVPTTDGRS